VISGKAGKKKMPKAPRYTSKELINMVEKDGWVLVGTKGGHHQFRHPVKAGRTTIPHPKKDLPPGTVKSILKQAGLE